MIGSVYYGDNYFEGKDGAVSIGRKNLDLIPSLDAIVLWGGEDICPLIYGQTPKYTYAHEISNRDSLEMKAFEVAVDHNIPILGVCRGAQLACALSGGSLWQHVDNHAGRDHPIYFEDGTSMYTNSLHHQMMRLPEDSVLVAWANHLSKKKFTDKEENETEAIEPEMAFFPAKKAFVVQGHPEYTPKNSLLTIKTKELFKHFCGVDL